jgi:hypothetical protein
MLAQPSKLIALDVFENDIEVAVVIAEIFGANDIRVLELSGESRFLLETRREDGIFCQMSMNSFDHRLPREAAWSCLFCQKYLGHTACTKAFDQFVASADDFVHTTSFSGRSSAASYPSSTLSAVRLVGGKYTGASPFSGRMGVFWVWRQPLAPQERRTAPQRVPFSLLLAAQQGLAKVGVRSL